MGCECFDSLWQTGPQGSPRRERVLSQACHARTGLESYLSNESGGVDGRGLGW